MSTFLWTTSSFQKITMNFKVFPNLVTLHTSHGQFLVNRAKLGQSYSTLEGPLCALMLL